MRRFAPFDDTDNGSDVTVTAADEASEDVT
jgi:hypothetical protein